MLKPQNLHQACIYVRITGSRALVWKLLRRPGTGYKCQALKIGSYSSVKNAAMSYLSNLN